MSKYDLIIIGAGPAGLTAGLYAVRKGLNVLVIEKQLEGGKVLEAYNIENYPGFVEKINGTDLVENIKKQVLSQGLKINTLEEVIDIKKGKNFFIKTSKSNYKAKAIILALGTHLRKLDLEGESEFRGKGVSYCATCDGPLFREKNVAVIGGGNTAVTSALYLSEICKKVYLIHRRDELRAEKALAEKVINSNVDIIWDSVAKKIDGDKLVNKIIVKNVKTDKTKQLDVDGVFILIGYEANNMLAKKIGINLTENGFIEINKKCQTNIDGIFAAGDITGVSLQIATAAGQGCTASLESYNYIKA